MFLQISFFALISIVLFFVYQQGELRIFDVLKEIYEREINQKLSHSNEKIYAKHLHDIKKQII